MFITVALQNTNTYWKKTFDMIESFKVLFSSEPVSALPPFGPTEGQKWFDHISNESPEEPVCINLFRQNPVFTSLHLKSPVHVVPPQNLDLELIVVYKAQNIHK